MVATRFVLIAALLGACTTAAVTKPDAGDELLVPVKTAAATTQPMPTFLTVTGSLIPNQQSDVAAGATGKVVKTFVERGSLVPQNQLLIALDSRTLSRQAEEAEANVQVAKRQRELADVQCTRSEKLFKDGAMTQDDYDKAKSNCETSKFQSTAMQARAEQALVGLNDSQIRAPFAGLVAERYVNVGEYVTPATKVVSLVELDPLRLELTVPEASLHLVQEGMNVVFSPATDPDRQFTGTIRYVGPSVRTSSRDLVVEALVPNPEHRLRPGQFVAARLVLGDAQEATVPKTALHEDGTLHRIYVVNSGRLEERLVELGEAKGDAVAVLNGVKPGEQVVTQAEGDLRDGSKIRQE